MVSEITTNEAIHNCSHRRVPHCGRRANRLLAARSGFLKRRLAPIDSARECRSRGIEFRLETRDPDIGRRTDMEQRVQRPLVSSVIRISICPLGRFLMCSSSARVSRSSLSTARPVSSYFSYPKNFQRSTVRLRRVTTCSAEACRK